MTPVFQSPRTRVQTFTPFLAPDLKQPLRRSRLQQARPSSPSDLSRADLQRLVAEMID